MLSRILHTAKERKFRFVTEINKACWIAIALETYNNAGTWEGASLEHRDWVYWEPAPQDTSKKKKNIGTYIGT